MVFIRWMTNAGNTPRLARCLRRRSLGIDMTSPHPKTMNSHLYSRSSTARPLSANTFIYDAKTNTWENRLDNVEKEWPSHSRASS